jgi:hypothetical protein
MKKEHEIKYNYQRNLTAERLRELLDYDAKSGKFFWRKRPCNRIKIGDLAGRIGASGCRTIQLDGKFYAAGRLAWLYVNGEWPKHIIRYLNKDQDDNRIENMRDTAAVTLGLKHDGGKFVQSVQTKEENVRNYYKNFFLKKTFGIDLAEYQRKFVEQKGCCAICEKPETGLDNKGRMKWLAVDHDHTLQGAESVRDLLCEKCNKALGLIGDDVDILRSAIRYLERHKKVEKVTPLHLVKEK